MRPWWRSPDAAQSEGTPSRLRDGDPRSDAPQIRGPRSYGSRLSSAPFHAALRPGHESDVNAIP